MGTALTLFYWFSEISKASFFFFTIAEWHSDITQLSTRHLHYTSQLLSVLLSMASAALPKKGPSPNSFEETRVARTWQRRTPHGPFIIPVWQGVCVGGCFRGIRNQQSQHITDSTCISWASRGWRAPATITNPLSHTAYSNVSPWLICSLPSSPKGRA